MAPGCLNGTGGEGWLVASMVNWYCDSPTRIMLGQKRPRQVTIHFNRFSCSSAKQGRWPMVSLTRSRAFYFFHVEHAPDSVPLVSSPVAHAAMSILRRIRRQTG